MAARGRNTFGFKVNLIVASDSSLESFYIGDQMLSTKQVWKVNGLAAMMKQSLHSH